MANWSLDGAAAVAAQFPYTFNAPSEAALRALVPGLRVQLGVKVAGGTQPLPAAVTIKLVSGAGQFGGTFDSPVTEAGISSGDSVAFAHGHILRIENDTSANPLAKYQTYCLVSNEVMKLNRPVGFLYREESDSKEDSGWCMTAGDETEAYMNSPANVSYVTLGALLNIDDSIVNLLDSPAGSEFVRVGDTRMFVAP
ncbi:DUF2185 domain-containing protein [Silvimonas amylolytica]|uniref:Immunity protein Imm33 domain-containing protein n=1 Tax=Silvimonas amylolytica TaxID=449663 RepID=A0ABQ2PRI5_9NEIS|nr:DUF2185 domain-containing protein [Silvimonas amylolytica]GGP27903.1 hypothetical protein GCM10010971_37220 [Silvimonas amylolytica]